jgi:hypothetical protein
MYELLTVSSKKKDSFEALFYAKQGFAVKLEGVPNVDLQD